MSYSPKLSGPMSGMSFTLNVDNLLDTNPPYLAGSTSAGYGYAGFTIGRYVQLGVSKKF
jgi:outer membrane receptor protein involved in Fe transport